MAESCCFMIRSAKQPRCSLRSCGPSRRGVIGSFTWWGRQLEKSHKTTTSYPRKIKLADSYCDLEGAERCIKPPLCRGKNKYDARSIDSHMWVDHSGGDRRRGCRMPGQSRCAWYEPNPCSRSCRASAARRP